MDIAYRVELAWKLTKRELQIIHLVALGYRTDTIASVFKWKIETLRRAIVTIYHKTGVHSRVGLVAWAWGQGLCE